MPPDPPAARAGESRPRTGLPLKNAAPPNRLPGCHDGPGDRHRTSPSFLRETRKSPRRRVGLDGHGHQEVQRNESYSKGSTRQRQRRRQVKAKGRPPAPWMRSSPPIPCPPPWTPLSAIAWPPTPSRPTSYRRWQRCLSHSGGRSIRPRNWPASRTRPSPTTPTPK